MNLSKLTPAPWRVRQSESHKDRWILADANNEYIATFEMRDVAEQVALARNDLDVKLRRGWHTERQSDGDWYVPQLDLPGHYLDYTESQLKAFNDAKYQSGHDVGLLTKADKWYEANVKDKPPA